MKDGENQISNCTQVIEKGRSPTGQPAPSDWYSEGDEHEFHRIKAPPELILPLFVSSTLIVASIETTIIMFWERKKDKNKKLCWAFMIKCVVDACSVDDDGNRSGAGKFSVLDNDDNSERAHHPPPAPYTGPLLSQPTQAAPSVQ